MSLKDIYDLLNGLQTPVLAFLVWLVYKIKTNELPHIYDRLGEIGERISEIEGIAEGVKLERLRK